MRAQQTNRALRVDKRAPSVVGGTQDQDTYQREDRRCFYMLSLPSFAAAR